MQSLSTGAAQSRECIWIDMSLTLLLHYIWTSRYHTLFDTLHLNTSELIWASLDYCRAVHYIWATLSYIKFECIWVDMSLTLLLQCCALHLSFTTFELRYIRAALYSAVSNTLHLSLTLLLQCSAHDCICLDKRCTKTSTYSTTFHCTDAPG